VLPVLLANHIEYAFVMEDCMLMFTTLKSDMLNFLFFIFLFFFCPLERCHELFKVQLL
jgi:hypothetical protein